MIRASSLAAGLILAFPLLATQQPALSEIERAVEEFKVQSRNLGLRADSPRASRRNGSGAGSWHGRVFWNFRNDFLDAVPHEVTQTGGDAGILRRNQYGFNISGPVIIPKLYNGGKGSFISISYEGMREKVGRSLLRTIPTMGERTGDYSQVVDKAGELLPIYDPATTQPNVRFDPTKPVAVDNLQYLRQPFPGNQIPAGRLDPVARESTAYYPAPNVSIGPFFQNNYSIYAPEINNADGMRIKWDHALVESHRLSVGFNFSNGFAGPVKFFPTIANPGSSDREFRSRNGSVDHVWTLSRNSINTMRFSAWVSRSQNVTEEGAEERPFPVFRFEPYVSMGRPYPVSRTTNTHYEISDGFSTKRGQHSLRFAGEWTWQMINSYWPQYPSGRFEFSEGLTSLPGIVNTGHAFSSFMLGLSRFAEGSLVEHPSYFRRGRGQLTARDEWEIRQGLTLNLGLTLNVAKPRVEKYDRQSTVDLEAINPENGRPGALVFANLGGQGRSFQPVQMGLEPWGSLSWSPFPDNKTVVRFSGSRRYYPTPLYSGQWGTQGFNGTPTYITQNAQLEPAVVLGEGMPPPPHSPPDLRPEAANDTVADLVDRSNRIATYYSTTLTIERQLAGSFVVAIGGSHSGGENIHVSNEGANPNAIPLDALRFRDLLNEEAFKRELRPFPQYQRFDVYSAYPVASYQRDEAYLRVEKRTSQGLSLRAVYEFAKQMDDYSSSDGLQDYYQRQKEWALTPYASPHTLSMSYMYELPLGPNKPFLSAADWRRHVAGGWMVSGETSYASGNPITLRALYNNTGGVLRTLYVDPVAGVEASVENPTPEQWFNPVAFVNPPDFSLGRLSRSHPQLRNPARQNHDVSVTKRFSLASDRAIEFIGTAFNFINHANWNQPDADIGSVSDPNVNAGRIIGSQGGRVVQLGLRLSF